MKRAVLIVVPVVLVVACSADGGADTSTSSSVPATSTEAVVATGSSPIDTVTTAAPVVTTTSVVVDSSWLREGWVSAGDELSPRPHPHTVTAAEFGLVAVGWACPGEVACPAAAWVSEDGLNWTGTVPGEDGLGDVSLHHVVAFGASVFAAGGSCSGSFDHPDDCGPAIFTSDDGLRWTVAAHEQFEDCSDATFEDCVMFATDMTTDGTRLVALIEEKLENGSRSVPWVSTDGFEWARGTGVQEPTLRFRQVFPTNGGFTAVGHRWETNGENWWTSFAVWNSPDGSTWTEIAQPDVPAGEDNFLWYATDWAGGFVAFGEVCSFDWTECSSVMWRSSDGTEWIRSSVPTELVDNGFGGAFQVGNLLVFPGEKTSGTNGALSTPKLIVTADFTNWDMHDHDAGQALISLSDLIEHNEMMIGVSAESGILVNQRSTG